MQLPSVRRPAAPDVPAASDPIAAQVPAGPVSRRSALTGGLAGLLGITATACSSRIAGGSASGSDGTEDTESSEGTGSATGFPLELANCEATVTFDAPPQRIVLLESAPVTTLDGIGVLDRVVARAGAFPPGYYDEELDARVGVIPTLSDDIDATGHLQISQEVVIAQAPDVVFGLPDGVTRDAMADAGAQVMVQDVFCGTDDERASFETLYSTITTYGRLFDHAQEAEDLTAALRDRVAAVSESAEVLRATTAAVLYPSLGGGPLYTYGAGSMVTAQLDALGIENVFAETAERVFEISSEPLLAADPDVLIVLHQGEGDGSDVTAEITTQAQLTGMRAMHDQAVLPLLFNFAEPASPLVVDGLERIHEWLLGVEG